MKTPAPTAHPTYQTVSLALGDQAVINGALVTAKGACSIEVSHGAFVMTGRKLRQARATTQNPSEELYFSLLEVEASRGRFEEERMRLFQLLSEIAVRDEGTEQQSDCTRCAVALMIGDAAQATTIAARLAAHAIEVPGPRASQTKHKGISRNPQTSEPQGYLGC